MMKINKKIIAIFVVLTIFALGADLVYAKKKKNKGNWQYDGVAFYTYGPQLNGTVPVYRFFNKKNGDHFYSMDATTPGRYIAEGIAFCAFSSQAEGTYPVFRFYNKKSGDHYYMLSSSQPDTPRGYQYEGIAFYAYPNQPAGTIPVYQLFHTGTGKHFYTDSESEKNILVGSSLGPDISVGLWTYSNSDLRDSSFKIDANKNYNIKDKNGNAIAQITAGTQTNVKYDDDGNFTVYNSISDSTFNTEVQFDAADGDNSGIIFDVHRPSSDYDRYRGKIKLRHTDSSNNWVINTLPLEHYVWGDGETSGTGDTNHTRVMTVIFRTYGYWYIKYATKYSAYGFKIRSDSGSQIYRGYDWEESHAAIRNAAQDTRAIIATYGGDVALTPYCSWSDGRTRSFEDVWGSSDYPWCKSVSDPYGKNPNMSTAELQAAGNHMVGLIANGSVHLAASHGWSYDKIMTYYYTGISLSRPY